ncbi:tetratricopeptide repeat protein [Streptomyces sp. AF1A]|jgi:tetratricopeptide (TPR) repeat protein|uniref:tetratricopeptide repeat protein n=1 Tax=Streptomyces sp. AF1A TaxID=3394350 RepID=UPI0039BC6B82
MQQADAALTGHLRLYGATRHDRAATADGHPLPPRLLPPVDAHRRLRGPYTAAGTVVRALVPGVLAAAPELVRRHDIELLSVAPELAPVVPNSRETLTSMALPAERTRFYARLRTRRIANGLVEFVRDALPALGHDGPRCLVVENADHAEATDAEFLATLVRRLDPRVLTVVLCGAHAPRPDGVLAPALDRHTTALPVREAGAGPRTGQEDPAWRWVAAEGLLDGLDGETARAAYEALPAAERAALHDRRAAELRRAQEFSLTLGALPYHLERGSAPVDEAVPALWAASDHCLVNGFYDAVVDYGRRGQALVNGREDPGQWWRFGVQLGLALSILSRTKEAEAVYDEARLLSTDPAVHMACAYSTAMLYTRHNDPADRDERKAKALLNSAIATASLLADRVPRAFQSAFYKNGRALVEVNLGDPQEALRLVTECIDDLDRRLTPDEHRLHRSVLKNNRARVYAILGRLDEALADYAVVIDQDPHHAEHYLERGNLLRRLGRTEEALADYSRALSLSPPFPEIYYNRGDLRLSEGDVEGALADFDYVIEQDPEFVDAYVNRAGIRLEAGDLAAALADARTGLGLEPDNAHLHAIVGRALAEEGELDGAEAAYDRAIESDPELVSALSGRAAVRHEAGRPHEALADLCRAVEHDPKDAALRYNRAFLHQETGRWQEALADLELAAVLDPEDTEIAEALTALRGRPGAA